MSGGNRDWLPRRRDGRIAMANTWWDVLSQKGIAWGVIEQPEIVAFAALIADTCNIFEKTLLRMPLSGGSDIQSTAIP